LIATQVDRQPDKIVALEAGISFHFYESWSSIGVKKILTQSSGSSFAIIAQLYS